MTPQGQGDALDPDQLMYREIATTLADVVDDVIGEWVVRSVLSRFEQSGTALTDAGRHAAEEAGAACRSEYGSQIRALVLSDIDQQATTPLALLRAATRYPTEVLRDAGVPSVQRDEFAERAFAADVYALSPANFAEVHERLREPGLVWGAAKAHLHLARRRAIDARTADPEHGVDPEHTADRSDPT